MLYQGITFRVTMCVVHRQSLKGLQCHPRSSMCYYSGNRIGQWGTGQSCGVLLQPSPSRLHKAWATNLQRNVIFIIGPLTLSPPYQLANSHSAYAASLWPKQGLTHTTSKCYLSAVRHLHIENGWGDPNFSSMPTLELVLKGGKDGTREKEEIQTASANHARPPSEVKRGLVGSNSRARWSNALGSRNAVLL